MTAKTPTPTLSHFFESVTIKTRGRGFYPLGEKLDRPLKVFHAQNGLLNVFLAHTSASLCIQENADPDVLADLDRALARLAPEEAGYLHTIEGPDDMPAHIKTLLTATSLALPVRGGSLALGRWQEVYLIEHRNLPHTRRIEIDFIGYVDK